MKLKYTDSGELDVKDLDERFAASQKRVEVLIEANKHLVALAKVLHDELLPECKEDCPTHKFVNTHDLSKAYEGTPVVTDDLLNFLICELDHDHKNNPSGLGKARWNSRLVGALIAEIQKLRNQQKPATQG